MPGISKVASRKSSPLWVPVAAVPLAGAVAAIAYAFHRNARHRWYTLLFLVPILGPLLAYVFTSSSDRYISSMAEWFFAGYVVMVLVLWGLALASVL